MSEINQEILIEIGRRVRDRRDEKAYSQKDISNMTGLTVNMISNFENGKGATLNNFLLICRALGLQPREILDGDIALTPPYNLPPESRRRIEVTRKLDKLVTESDFFETPRRVAEVIKEVGHDKSESNKFSVYLSGYCKEGHLDYIKAGKIKKYVKRK